MSRPKELGWQHVVAKAFTWRWNLLVFAGVVVAALISGAPDVVLPFVVAAEATYLGAMTANPKFRKAVAAQQHKALHENDPSVRAATSFKDVLERLYPIPQRRFTELRDRCLEMGRLAAGVRGEGNRSAGKALHTDSLDRMLWVFLRLLASQQALEQFLKATDAAAMRNRVTELEAKIAAAKKEGNEKILRALVDSVVTAQLRVDNLAKAKENSKFVGIELDRIEDKIQVLVEMAVGHEDPDFISSQVDSVAASILHTEEAMRELSFIPGVDDLEEATPSILSQTENAY